jgi:predicted DNA-binding ribbon-helix-helix protein
MVVCMKPIANCRIWGARHRISIRLDRVAREALSDIAGRMGCTVNDLLTEIDRKRQGSTLAAATLSYVVAYYRAIMQAELQGDAGSPVR